MLLKVSVMAGVTSIEVKESLDQLVQQLQQVETPRDKERLQVLYWLKQEKSPSIGAIAKAIGKQGKLSISMPVMPKAGARHLVVDSTGVMFRFKTIFGESLSARKFDNQAVELFIKCAALNRMIQLAKPDSYVIEA
jgi:hypothetical protein